MPWHLGDQHNHQHKPDLPTNGASTNSVSDHQTCQTDQTAPAPAPATHDGVGRDRSRPTLPPPPGADTVHAPDDSQLAPAATASTSNTCEKIDFTGVNTVGEGGGTRAPNQACADQSRTSTSGSVGSVSAPTPSVPRHGVRIDGVAGAGVSVVYQRYCHMYAEGELKGLVESVDGLRVVESYYDRSNWCIVAERKM